MEFQASLMGVYLKVSNTEGRSMEGWGWMVGGFHCNPKNNNSS